MSNARSYRVIVVVALGSAFVLAGCGHGNSHRPSLNATQRAALAAPRGPAQSGHFVLEQTYDDPATAVNDLSFHTDGYYVAPDSYSGIMVVDRNGQTARLDVIAVGSEAWLRFYQTDWVRVSRTNPFVSVVEEVSKLFSISAARVSELAYSTEGIPDTINGRDALRYSQKAPDDGTPVAGPSGGNFLEVAIWLPTDFTHVLRIELHEQVPASNLSTLLNTPEGGLLNTETTITVDRYNDPDIEISPPTDTSVVAQPF